MASQSLKRSIASDASELESGLMWNVRGELKPMLEKACPFVGESPTIYLSAWGLVKQAGAFDE